MVVSYRLSSISFLDLSSFMAESSIFLTSELFILSKLEPFSAYFGVSSFLRFVFVVSVVSLYIRKLTGRERSFVVVILILFTFFIQFLLKAE